MSTLSISWYLRRFVLHEHGAGNQRICSPLPSSPLTVVYSWTILYFPLRNQATISYYSSRRRPMGTVSLSCKFQPSGFLQHDRTDVPTTRSPLHQEPDLRHESLLVCSSCRNNYPSTITRALGRTTGFRGCPSPADMSQLSSASRTWDAMPDMCSTNPPPTIFLPLFCGK
jgi:hypothetical protein